MLLFNHRMLLQLIRRPGMAWSELTIPQNFLHGRPSKWCFNNVWAKNRLILRSLGFLILLLQACVGLHISQVHLWADQEVRGWTNRQPKHILVSNVFRICFQIKLTRVSFSICSIAIVFFLCRVIFELLWRDYFKFVGLKYGDRIFQINGKSGLKKKCVTMILQKSF